MKAFRDSKYGLRFQTWLMERGLHIAQWAVGSRIVSKIVKMPPSPVSTHAK